MRKKVYLIQPNHGTGSGEFKSHWLPYSVGCLWAYASSFDDIESRYELAGLYFDRSPVQTVIDGMAEPAVVGFSTYVWNANYNRELARAIKARWPDTTIIFGGPEVPDDPRAWLREAPFIDISVHKEGELTFLRLLRSLLEERPSFEAIDGVGYREGKEIVFRAGHGRVDTLASLPSPYARGVFDALVAANPDSKWAGTLESNRGCPFKCQFCDWGSAVFTKVKSFPMDRVRGDLQWLGENKIEYVFVADANFGIFKERDAEISEHILDVVQRTGHPKTFCIQWHKNSNSQVVHMARKLSSVQKGLTLSVQSLDASVLSAIERRNMDLNNLSEILAICDAEGLPSYTELILGLPEETLTSWKENFHRLLDLGQHCAIDIWIAQVLRNSALNRPESLAMHRIETVRARDYLTGSPDGTRDSIPEEIELIRSTRTMPFEDFVDAYMYAWMILNFHLYGWTQLAARFMRQHSELEYADFYSGLFELLRGSGDGILQQQYKATRARVVTYLSTGRIEGNLVDEIGIDLEVYGHNLLWLSQMVFRCHAAETLTEVSDFLGRFEGGLSDALLRDLREVQEHAMIVPGATYPHRFTVGSNLVEATLQGVSLEEHEAVTYEVDHRRGIRESVPSVDDLGVEDFLYMLYYRRRMGPGIASFKRRTQLATQA